MRRAQEPRSLGDHPGLKRRDPENRRSISSGLRTALGLVLAVALAGCASQASGPPPADGGAPAVAQLPSAQADAALDQLCRHRLTEHSDFPIGPGDVLQISVPNVKELNSLTARVDGKGDLRLPLVGSLHVAGLTEPEVTDHLTIALHKYVYHPEINLLVKSYSSRVVGVMGAVRTPGLYVLNGPGDTIHDLIERAGGLTDYASREVVLSPVPPGSGGRIMLAQQAASAASMPAHRAAPSATAGEVESSKARGAGAVTNTALETNHSPWIKPPSEAAFSGNSAYVISLNSNSPYRNYVNLPLRPGDTLFVPSAGQVSVVGWVYHPMVLSVTHGLTTLGAVSAAGGLMWAADPTAVKILRRHKGDETRTIEVNLAAVKNGKAPDVALKANDVVEVGYSTAKLPGYALYYAVTGIVQMAPAAAVMSGF